MRAYLSTSGAIFGLLVAVHVWRALEEGTRVLRDPWYVGATIVAAALCAWAVRLLRVS